MQKRIVALCLSMFVLIVVVALAQEKKASRPSPASQAQCQFGDGKTIHVDYSSPRAKGRKIYGGLVPYGEVARTGANEATTFVTDTNLTVNGKDVPAGSYTIFTIPNQGKWTLIINKKTGEWGIPYKYEGDELLRADNQLSKTPSQVENFTIAFDQAGNNCTMHLDWENTRASVAFEEKK